MAAETLRQEAQRILCDIPCEYVFRCCNGHTLNNLKELKNELESMSDDHYAYHVNAENNDFTNWVRDIFKDERLAKDLQKAPNRSKAARLVGTRIDILAKRLA